MITTTLKPTRQLSAILPKYIWQNAKLPSVPSMFTPSSAKLNSMAVFSVKQQMDMYEEFCLHPNKPQTYVVTSSPDPQNASLFAARLVQAYLKKYGQDSCANVCWYSMNQFKERPAFSYPNLLVISTLYENSSYKKIDEVRDLVEFYHDIPKIVIGAGIDPISLACGVLNIPVHSVFYQSSINGESKIKVM